MAKDKLIELISDVVLNEGKNAERILSDASSLGDMYVLAEKHQMQHIVGYAMMSLGDMRLADKFYTSYAVTKQQMHTVDVMSRALSDAKIDHIFLKGAKMRELYPESWMRNSCDVDLLVRKEDHKHACEVLSDLGYAFLPKRSTPHDVTFEIAEARIELHHTLIEDFRMKGVSKILDGVWDDARRIDGGYRLDMSPEMFYFYHVAHTAKHFGNGGCGIRSILDMHILRNTLTLNREKLDEMLNSGGLSRFNEKIGLLSRNWFGGGSNPDLEAVEKYIINGGVYGNADNGSAVVVARRGGFRYFMSLMFPTYKEMCRKYKVLEKHPYLLPILWVVRWMVAPFKRGKHYWADFKSVIHRSQDGVEDMISDLGLSDFC